MKEKVYRVFYRAGEVHTSLIMRNRTAFAAFSAVELLLNMPGARACGIEEIR